jgi:SPP1 family predicted phage head-tail adaptor
MLQSTQQIGKLDRLVTFIERIISTGESNEDKTDGWQEIATTPTIWASKEDQQGYEAVIADRLTYIQPCKWIVRYEDAVGKNEKMRLVYESRVYEIQAITDLSGQRKRYLEVVTKLLDNEYFT